MAWLTHFNWGWFVGWQRQMAAEKGVEMVALECLGKRFNLASNFRLRFAKGIQKERLVVLDEQNKRDILIPGTRGVTIKGVSKNIHCDKGDYDVVSLCFHIDDHHPVQAKIGVCPICWKKVGLDLVRHITTQHGNFLRVQRKRRVRKVGSGSTMSILRKELREGALQSLLGSSSYLASSNSEPDPLLSSFMFNPAVTDDSFVEDTLVKESLFRVRDL
ncbi:hypothetical protein JHK84_045102 [Glycine max]|nr:hypothetical protein JHK86_045046 [Glycine max]KAG4951747.1 hypothetical protein JHK85_045614 [Glycine max]KAG5108195.1 hypothetical protein JHK84_045102 [Glycine max]